LFATIVIAVWLGGLLDNYLKISKFPIFLVIFLLGSVIGSLLNLIRSLNKESQSLGSTE
jgi:F0F1-type ATP synthase assembly protein I